MVPYTVDHSYLEYGFEYNDQIADTAIIAYAGALIEDMLIDRSHTSIIRNIKRALYATGIGLLCITENYLNLEDDRHLIIQYYHAYARYIKHVLIKNDIYNLSPSSVLVARIDLALRPWSHSYRTLIDLLMT